MVLDDLDFYFQHNSMYTQRQCVIRHTVLPHTLRQCHINSNKSYGLFTLCIHIILLIYGEGIKDE